LDLDLGNRDVNNDEDEDEEMEDALIEDDN